MASGSSGRSNSGSKGFDFATDDILCSYEDYGGQETANHSDPTIGTATAKDFQKSRISRSSVFPTTNVYSPPEESYNQELISTVERTMKKYADNLMRFLEGISSRLSQLELYCYNLDKSIGEMRSDLIRDNGEADTKLKTLEKHVQEVHRSVQILRDKQELADTQKELAKLQLAQRESSSSSHEERTVSAPDSKKSDDVSDTPNTQLALALPSQIAPQPSHLTMQQQSVPPLAPPPSQTQLPSYYLPSAQLPNPQTQSQPSYLPADMQYRAQQLPPPQPHGPQPVQSQVNQTPQSQQFSQYQQQWPPQVSQPMQPPQLSSMPPQNPIRAPTPQSNVYSPYMAGQHANPPTQETMVSMPMQMPFPGLLQPGISRAEAMQYGYGATGGRPVQPQPPPPHIKGGFPPQPNDGYQTAGSHPPISSAGTYMVYDGEGARPHHSPQPAHYSQGGYPPANPNPPPPTSSGLMIRNPSPQQFLRNHPYNELIDKLVNMGYRGDHVVSVIQRLEDSGQPVDFNAVLDRLNGHPSGSSQRGGW